jgi:tetratricopeptide (TPR) repeat protein
MSKPGKIRNHALRNIREVERQETRAEFAEAMQRKARELGEAVSPSERYVARLEDGDVKYPHPAYRRVLTELCQRPVAELGFTLPESIHRIAAESVHENDSVYPLDTQRGLAIALPSLREIESVRRSLDATVNENPMSETAIEDWERSALQYGRATRYQSPDVLLSDLTADLAELNDILSRCRSASAMRRLTIVAAQMAGLMCLTLVKLDDRIAFRRWARTARIAAEEAGDPRTLSWVRAQEAYGHYYSGDMMESIRVARHAQDVVASTPCVGAALAAALEARAQARIGPGRPREVRDALERAELIMSRLDPDSMIPSAFGYNEAQLRFHEGNAYTHLRDSRAAWRAQERALELAPQNDYTDRALTKLDRAICLAHDGDSTGAIASTAEALTGLTEYQREGIITARADEMLRTLPPSHLSLPAARDVKDLLAIASETDKGAEE